MLRYSQLHANASDGTDDAKFWSLAISLTLQPSPPAPPRQGPPPPPPAPRARAAARAGTPTRTASWTPTTTARTRQRATIGSATPRRPTTDADKDGVTDDADKCPNEAQGPFADPGAAAPTPTTITTASIP
jgi:hypothetical protein